MDNLSVEASSKAIQDLALGLKSLTDLGISPVIATKTKDDDMTSINDAKTPSVLLVLNAEDARTMAGKFLDGHTDLMLMQISEMYAALAFSASSSDTAIFAFL
eukprot:11888112-Ditylum_brightwellii.AAC.1